MKKILCILTMMSFTLGLSANAVFYTAPNVGNSSFYPMMQRQMEKQEMLDFENDPEHYSEKREQQEQQRQYEQNYNNKNFKTNPSKKDGNGYFNYSMPQNITPPKMEFTKDNSGNIIIKEMSK